MLVFHAKRDNLSTPQATAATTVLLGHTASAVQSVRVANILTDATRVIRRLGCAAGVPQDTNITHSYTCAADARETRSATTGPSAEKDHTIVLSAAQQKSFVFFAKLDLG